MPDSAGEAFVRSVPASKTLLRHLVRERHWEYETLSAEYDKAGAQAGVRAAARTALGLMLGEFAVLLGCALGRAVTAEAAGRWECGGVPPGDVVVFCRAFLAGAHDRGPAGCAGGRDELTEHRAARGRR